MLENIFLTINSSMSTDFVFAGLGCFFWGMVSVLLDPCHLASIPLIAAYVGGQQQALNPKQAGVYSCSFALGLLISIALIGIVCALMGQILVDVGNFWQILVGSVLIWVALGMLGIEKCSMPGSLLYRLNLKGLSGAFGLGLVYGIISGSCTLGFIAPILVIITVQHKIAAGAIFTLLFGIGHCLPIVVAGSSIASVRKLIENSTWQNTGIWFRRAAGIVILLLGLYFISNLLILF